MIQLLVLGVLGLLAVNIWRAFNDAGKPVGDQSNEKSGPIIEGSAETLSPGDIAAERLAAFENATAEIKAAYPVLTSMFGGYLNGQAIADAGGIEGAVKTMINEWTGRRSEITTELTRVLSENETEAAARAIVVSLCDADFDDEGYRKWLIWLLGQFNTLG
ncbi:MAG: hypothetical protein AAF668_13210 [Pseudomonadota bacterium]